MLLIEMKKLELDAVCVWLGGLVLIDLVNFVVGCLASFVVGLAAHSILLHEKERHGWRFPWDHDEEEDDED